jgi:hypothetical protein
MEFPLERFPSINSVRGVKKIKQKWFRSMIKKTTEHAKPQRSSPLLTEPNIDSRIPAWCENPRHQI